LGPMVNFLSANSDCMVIGAGLTGMVAALRMAGQGLKVTIIDAKTPQAILNDLEAEVLIFRRYSLDALEDLRERSWLGCKDFIEKTEKTTGPAWMQPFSQLELVVSKTDLDPAQADCEQLRRHGANVEFLSQADLGKFDSAINPDLFGAILHHDAAAVESDRLYRSLWQACDKEKRINLFWETQAMGIEVGNKTAVLRTSIGPIEVERIVLTVGVAALSIISSTGVQLPVVPEIQYRLIGDPSRSKSSQTIFEYKPPNFYAQRTTEESDDGDLEVDLSVSFRPDRQTSAGYGKEFVATGHSSGQTAMLKICRRITRILPGYSDLHFSRVVSRFEPVVADGIPIVGPAPNVEGLFLALCPKDNKGSLSPAVGEYAAGWVITGKTSEKTEILSPKRFPQTAPGGLKRVTD